MSLSCYLFTFLHGVPYCFRDTTKTCNGAGEKVDCGKESILYILSLYIISRGWLPLDVSTVQWHNYIPESAGHLGIDEAGCNAKGCCWEESEIEVSTMSFYIPWHACTCHCYIKHPYFRENHGASFQNETVQSQLKK